MGGGGGKENGEDASRGDVSGKAPHTHVFGARVL